MSEIKFTHVNVVAEDWKKLAGFYVDVLGCTPKPPERDLSGEWLDYLTGLDNARINGIHLKLPGGGAKGPTLEVFQYDSNSSDPVKQINMPGFAHIAFSVDDVEKYAALIIENGGSLVGDIVRTGVKGAGEIHVVYARDPEGNIIEIQKWM